MANKGTVLGELDRLLNKGEPPDLELIFILPFPNRTLFGKPLAYTNPFGHVALRYRLAPSQETVVVNVIGFESPQMVNFVKPEDFFFGTHGWHVGNEQGGIYNRNFVSLRIERVSAWQLQELHTFFLDLHMRWKEGQVHYVFGLDGKLRNIMSQQFKCGNCSDWIGYGLQKVGLVDDISMLPKILWIKMYKYFLQAEVKIPFRNMHVVKYNRIPHLNSYGADADVSGWGNMVHFHDRQTYSSLSDLAELEVYLPKGEKSLAICRRDVSNFAPHIRDKFEHPSAEFVLPRVGTKWAVACTDSWRLISRVSGELKQIVRSPSGQAWAIDHQQRLHMWDGEKWLQATPRTEALTLEEDGDVILPAIVTVDKKEGRPFVLAQDRRTIFELGADSQGAMELEVDDPNNGKGKHRCLEYNSDDHSSVSCRLVVEAAKSMMPIADLAFTTSEDLYAVTTDGRLHRYSKWVGWEVDAVNNAHLRSIDVDTDGALYAITSDGRILWRTEWLQKWHAFSHEWNAKQITTWNRFTTWAVDDRSRAYVLNPTTCEWDALGNSADQWPISGLAATSNDEPWALVTDQPGSTAVLLITRHRLEFMAAEPSCQLAKVKSHSANGHQMRFYRAEPLKRVPSDEFLEQTHLESQVYRDKKKRRVQRQEEKERVQAEIERGADSSSGIVGRLREKLGTILRLDERSRRARNQRQLIRDELTLPKSVQAADDKDALQGQALDGLEPVLVHTKTNLWANLEVELRAGDEQARWHSLGDVADNAAYRRPIYPALLAREVPPLQRGEYVQALVPPKGFALVYSSMAAADRPAETPGVSVWRPIPPTSDYAAVGHVVTRGKAPLATDRGYPCGCLHKSLLSPGAVSDAHLLLWQPEWMREGKLYVSHVVGAEVTHAGTTLVCPSLFVASEERGGEEVFLPPLPREHVADPSVLLCAPHSPSSPSAAQIV